MHQPAIDLDIYFECAEIPLASQGLLAKLGHQSWMINGVSLNSLISSLEYAFNSKKINRVRLNVFSHLKDISPSRIGQKNLEEKSIKDLLDHGPFESNLINSMARKILGGPVSKALESDASFHFFVDGDMIFSKTAVSELISEYLRVSEHAEEEDDFMLTPFEGPHLYAGPKPSQFFVGRDRYWRTTEIQFHEANRPSIRTLFLAKKTLLRFKEAFLYDQMRRAAFLCGPTGLLAGDHLEPVLRLIPCFSPMPSLCASLLESQLPFFTGASIQKGIFNAEFCDSHSL